MTALQTSGLLDRALDVLHPRVHGIAAAIRAAGPRAGLELHPSRRGPLTGTLEGVPLASRHDPLEEARRLAGQVDLCEHAVVVVHGFGLGHHVAELCRRMGRTGVVIVLEPDLQLLHSVLGAIDLAPAIAASNLVLVTDPADRGTLARHLQDAEWLLGQGVAFVDHPPSRDRLDEAVRTFGRTLTGVATHARMTVTTTLLRSIDTVRNLVGNLPRYAVAPGVADLAGRQAGRPAILVAAGPSLGPSLDVLAAPGLRDRAVIVAAQTTLRPLLERGIRPHFVTALDYHAISTRFYEGLTAEDVRGVELVVDPKAHPSILDAFPGTVRCCRSAMLDTLLGASARPMGTLPAGATVAHLSAYLARHLGCDPIITVGQDLGFTDGLYYGPGAVIHDVWGPELGPFNPITSMEWQRIARHRRHLQRIDAWDGGTVLSDAQMVTYLQQFERDFDRDRESGLRVLDATGPGGARKRGAEHLDLAEAIDREARRALAPMPPASSAVDDAAERRRRARTEVRRARADVDSIRAAATASGSLLDRMLGAQDDPRRMARLFERLDGQRAIVADRMTAFGLIEHLNQLGAFKRVRADRRMALAAELPPRDRQRAELERDLVNVAWIADAATELLGQLDPAIERLGRDGSANLPAPASTRVATPVDLATLGDAEGDAVAVAQTGRVIAVVAIDRADADRLGAPFRDCTLLEATLERLGACRRIDEVVLVMERGTSERLAVPATAGTHPIRRVTVDRPPVGPRGRAVRVARAGARGAWRGGIAGFGGADDGLSPAALGAALADAADDVLAIVPCGPDRPLLDPAAGVDALVDRWREHPGSHRLVFTPLPPGLGAVLLRRDLAVELAGGGRLGGVGPMLVHQPHVPQGDPLTTAACVSVPPTLRRHVDAIAGDASARARLERIAAVARPASGADRIVADLAADADVAPPGVPAHLLLELGTGGRVPPFRRCPGGEAPALGPADVRRLADRLRAAGPLDGTLVTITGDLDPLEHDGWLEVAAAARGAGAAAVHVRTALDVEPAVAAALASAPVDIISVELHACTAATWHRMHDRDGFARVLAALNALDAARSPLDEVRGPMAIALPWIVPRLQRRPETLAELEGFHDHWQRLLGTAVVEPAWPDEIAIAAALATPDTTDTRDATDRPILPLDTPPAVRRRELAGRMRILSDGRVPRDDRDRTGRTAVASLADHSLADAWARLQAARRDGDAHDGLLEP